MIDTAAVRRRLREEMRILSRRQGTLEDHLRNADRDLPDDEEDMATAIETDQVMEALDGAALASLRAIQIALKRLDAGTYAECEVCGEEIGEKRLAALPTATRCIEHAD